MTLEEAMQEIFYHGFVFTLRPKKALEALKVIRKTLLDYEQLKSDYIELDKQLRTANTEIDRLQSAISWIPCGERLPEAREIVLVYTHRRGFTLDFLDVYVSNGKRFFHNSDVTHWMSLPQPPNKRGDAQ